MDVLNLFYVQRMGSIKVKIVERQIRRVVYPAGKDIMAQGDPPDNVLYQLEEDSYLEGYCSKDSQHMADWPTFLEASYPIGTQVILLIELGRGGFLEKGDRRRLSSCRYLYLKY